MKLLRVVGRTVPDDREVVAGVFRFYETHGLQLDVLVGALWRTERIVDWLDFWDGARAAGVKASRLVMMIEAALADAVDVDESAAVVRRLRLLRPEAK